ncbi:MAG: hypothetical protein IT428_00850 [Planctomycetaceae bacterium]|nr:hypothetical protein [Planctomycetaceae bacterium]
MTNPFVERQQAMAKAAAELDRIATEFPELFHSYLEFIKAEDQAPPKTAPRQSMPSRTQASEPSPGAEAIGRRLAPRLQGKTLYDAAYIIMKETGQPMRSAEIADVLKAAGVTGEGSPDNLRNGVFTAMGRHPEMFQKVERGLWALKNDDDRPARAIDLAS